MYFYRVVLSKKNPLVADNSNERIFCLNLSLQKRPTPTNTKVSCVKTLADTMKLPSCMDNLLVGYRNGRIAVSLGVTTTEARS